MNLWCLENAALTGSGMSSSVRQRPRILTDRKADAAFYFLGMLAPAVEQEMGHMLTLYWLPPFRSLLQLLKSRLFRQFGSGVAQMGFERVALVGMLPSFHAHIRQRTSAAANAIALAAALLELIDVSRPYALKLPQLA